MSKMKNYPKVSAVMCTYGRFTCVERAMNCFLNQTYPNKELIIFNTDNNNPYSDKECKLEHSQILLINCGVDFHTKEPYTNVGAIRRDALLFADGDYVVTWDDDDVFMPWFMQQAVDRMQQTGLPSFKPEMSFFYSGHLGLVRNTLEASVVADMKKVREYGYLLETGKEGLAWYTKMRDNKELDEYDKHYLPSYCFNWHDGNEMNAPHKQSGDINNPNNFNNHKEASKDYVDGRQLNIFNKKSMDNVYRPYFSFIKEHSTDFPKELLDKYFTHLEW
jgi:glycosyltransferase involved in cell wall biosynthesis